MSAYVNRLIERFAPASGDGRAQAEPFVRSLSPITEYDQRSGSNDSLVPESVGPSDDAIEFATPRPEPQPARIQRKAIAQPSNAGLSAASAPAPATSTLAAPAVRPAVAASPAVTASPTVIAPPIAEPASAPPRREPMDPGPLFDVVPRYYDDARAPAPASVAPAPIEPSARAPQVVERRTPSIPTPAKTMPVRSERNEAPRQLVASPMRELELEAPMAEPSRPAPWTSAASPSTRALAFTPARPTIEPHVSEQAQPPVALLTPAKPRPLPPAIPMPTPASAPEAGPEPRPAPPHYATPRAPAPAPYVPARNQRADAELGAAARPRVHIGRVEIEVIPSATPAPAASDASTPKQRLSIDSISKIGPLDQYFPNRRLLRLRYR